MTDPDNLAPDHSAPHDPEAVPGEVLTDPEDPSSEGRSPYQNLWVPLVVVPAMVVMVLLAVAAFFGLVAGEEASLEENLHDVMHGGSNERTHAVYNLARQVAENARAQAEGEEAPWPVPAGFGDDVRRHWDDLDADDWAVKQVFAGVLASLGEEEGVPRLLEILHLPPGEDPDGKIRFKVIAQLGMLGDERATPDLITFLDDPDDGLRAASAIALQNLPGEDSQVALARALGDEDFEVRANAAVSLSRLGDDAGAELLRELTGLAPYDEQRAIDRARYNRADLVSANRVAVVHALARLERDEDRELFENLREDDDVLVREAAMMALQSGEER